MADHDVLIVVPPSCRAYLGRSPICGSGARAADITRKARQSRRSGLRQRSFSEQRAYRTDHVCAGYTTALPWQPATTRYRPLATKILGLFQDEPERSCITSMPWPTCSAIAAWQPGIGTGRTGLRTHLPEPTAPSLLQRACTFVGGIGRLLLPDLNPGASTHPGLPSGLKAYAPASGSPSRRVPLKSNSAA